jgi:hypothetical protein
LSKECLLSFHHISGTSSFAAFTIPFFPKGDEYQILLLKKKFFINHFLTFII